MAAAEAALVTALRLLLLLAEVADSPIAEGGHGLVLGGAGAANATGSLGPVGCSSSD